jgi:cell wall-associated NlpC family hydrolase
LIQVVEDIKASHAPDSRLELFQIDLKKSGNRIFVMGEMTDARIKTLLLDSLRKAKPEYTVVDSVALLPGKDLKETGYGIVRVSVAQMRRQPARSSEQVSQTLLGTVLRLYKEKDGFYFVHNWDRYLGWVAKSSLVPVDSLSAARWKEGSRVVCVANYGLVRDRSHTDGNVIVDLVPDAVLKKVGKRGGWVKVETPDGLTGWVEKDQVMDEAEFRRIRANPDRIAATTRRFLGIPYLWGGTSAKGLDCSGLVQTVYRLNNISLPRDANQIALEGETVDIGDGFGNLRKGDVLFFGSKPDRITHCAVYLGDGRYIHSTTSVSKVVMNSLYPDDPLYYEYLHNTIRAAKRIMPE